MRIAICDDERICIEQVMAVATRYAASHADRRFTFDTFFHPEDLTEAAEKIGGYDIYILDVVMPGMNGISLGVKLREAGYDGKIIYLTSSSEYSLDAFRVRALDYLIKPIEDGSFFKAMDDAAALISEKKEQVSAGQGPREKHQAGLRQHPVCRSEPPRDQLSSERWTHGGIHDPARHFYRGHC